MPKDTPKIHRVLGMPPMWTDQVDPDGRVFAETFFKDSFIMNVMPGVPRFIGGALRNAKTEALERALVEQTGNGLGLYKENYNYAPSDEWRLHSSSSPEAKASSTKVNIRERDLRFYSFAPNISQYKRALNILMTELGNKMAGFSIDYNIEKWVDDTDIWNRGFAFYLDGSSSFSESASSELGESTLAGAVNQASQIATEMSFLSGNYQADIIASNNSDMTKQYGKSAQKITQSQGKNMVQQMLGIGGKVMGQLGEAAGWLTDSQGLTKVATAGERLIFPKVWKGSSYDKSYNLNFKFYSPSGDAQSILNYVYFPFLCWFALAVPLQGSVESIKSPFIIRCDCPGLFSCDMGMVTSFSFTRGGSENLWTVNGLPQCIEVSVTITDVYPTMCISTNSVLFSQNVSLQNMITNLSGLETMRYNFVPSLRANFARKISAFTTLGRTVSDTAKDSIYTVGEALSEYFAG